MSSDFDKLTEDEQDDVARAKMRDILAKPELDERDVATVAACVAFIGSSPKIADKFAQALLDASESLSSGLCVRCGSEPPGTGPASCLICQSIRSVQTLKIVERKGHVEEGPPREETKAPEPIEALAMTPGIKVVEAPVTKPWTEKELNKLKMNAHLHVETLVWLMSRTAEEIQEKLKEVSG
uniref:Uncharacterized protein n=1 Tax=viral metagenome TaxID=1070528 RepID=A0A6M3MF85_9ZZZZ